MIRKMNAWGTEGCRTTHREEIIAHLREAYDEAGVTSKLLAFGLAVASGLAWKIDRSDPLGWMLDEACRRAEAKLSPAGKVQT